MSSIEGIFIGPYVGQDDGGEYRLAVKDNIDIAGTVSTAGSRSRQSVAPAVIDAPVVAALKASGRVIVVGKTNLDEFAAGATGENPWFGEVLNPTDPSRMIGGSSSGSAAAVATGLADIALGTDTGGSVRIPAALTGITSLKTSQGLLSTHGVHPLSQMLDTVGPMALNVDAVEFALGAMAPSMAQDKRNVDFDRLRVGRLRFAEPETTVDEVIDEFLETLDAEVLDVEIAGWAEAHQAAYTILSVQAWHNNQKHFEDTPDDIGVIAKSVLMAGQATSSESFAQALAFQARWSALVEDMFADFDVLICPTVSREAPALADLHALDWANFSRTMQFNLSGHPALNLPMRLPDSALTLGMQCVGSLGNDAMLLKLGREFEKRITTHQYKQSHSDTEE